MTEIEKKALALVKRLRGALNNEHIFMPGDLTKAADLIETQAREIERLREALRRIDTGKYDGLEVHRVSARQCHAIARAALKGTDHDRD